MTKAVAAIVALVGLVATQMTGLSFIFESGLGETFAILGGGLVLILGIALVR